MRDRGEGRQSDTRADRWSNGPAARGDRSRGPPGCGRAAGSTSIATTVQCLDRMLQALELRVPPVLVAAIAAGAMWLAAARLPGLGLPLPLRGTVGPLLAGAGAVVGVAGVAAFRRRRTTVDPTRPEAVTALVREGIYRRTRNPMYLGLAMGLAGWAWWLANAAAVALVAVFVAWIDRLQIVPEERALRRKFGAEFDRYAARVRRWI